MDDDPYDLERFVAAQDYLGTYESAVAEMRNGHKLSHWMWFVFPQVAGLGASPTSVRFAISGLGEAGAYLRHRVLGPRLIECASVLLELEGTSAEGIFGAIDACKLRSSMTLFMRCAPDEKVFLWVLERYFGGLADVVTDQRLEAGRA
jgi:uncharacterized protein (DUF1810 family)